MEDEYSLLRPLYRQYLRGETDLKTSEDDRATRKRIRERVQLGLDDIPLLNQYAESRDIKQIFHREDDEYETGGNQQSPREGNRATLITANWVPVRHFVSMAWHGLRANGMDKDEIFEKVIVRGIEWGEAEYQGVEDSQIESRISLDKLEYHTDTSDMDPVEKWKRGLGLTPNDIKELDNRLPEGEDIGNLLEKHLKQE
jgi:hypothetical protein